MKALGSLTKTVVSRFVSRHKAQSETAAKFAKIRRAIQYPKQVEAHLVAKKHPKASLMGKHCWIEAIPVKWGGKKIRLYGAFIRPHVQVWQRSFSRLSLRKFLTTHILPKLDPKLIEQNTMVYMDANQRAQYKTSFKEGKIRHGDTPIKDGDYIFVLDDPGQAMYVREKQRGKYNHSSFFSGGPVQGAGVITIKDGKLAAVEYASGHYRPAEREEQNVRRFLETTLGKKTADAIPHTHKERTHKSR